MQVARNEAITYLSHDYGQELARLVLAVQNVAPHICEFGPGF